MPTNASEEYLRALAEGSFLKLWTIPNPFRSTGKELADLVVVFGDSVIIFSDKASTFDGNDLALGWSRWRQRTISQGVKQLAGAVRTLTDPQSLLFLDRRATQPLPFDLAAVAKRRLYLVAVVRPDHDPTAAPLSWQPLTYAARGPGPSAPFEIGPEWANGRFVHVFDGQAIELLLKHLSTAPDFLSYLSSREGVLPSRPGLVFSEPDLFALATDTWTRGYGFNIDLPQPAQDGITYVPKGLWLEYCEGERSIRTQKLNTSSLVIDRLIDHFHTEDMSGRNYYPGSRPTALMNERCGF